MKVATFIVCLFMISGAFTHQNNFNSGIQGIVDPVYGVRKIWAINGLDTASAIPAYGRFMIEAKPGTWILYVQAIPPYKNVAMDNIFVQDGQYTDVGVIQLVQSNVLSFRR